MNIFWDYKTIDTTTKVGEIAILQRKIMFGDFSGNDIPTIKKYFNELSMPDYWRYYFIVYFKKYDTHGETDQIS